jgi:hypothetical protein
MAIGDRSQVAWQDAPAWQVDSAIAGVEGVLAGNSPTEQHELWCAHKRAEGWVFGPVKDAVRKTHPCLLPYHELPVEQQRKDAIYIAVVGAMARALDLTPAGA